MVKQLSTRKTRLRMALMACVALLGVQTMQAQHAFEFAGRIGANALLYNTNYGSFMPNYDAGVDFSYKWRSPYYVGLRVGLGVEVAASTFVGTTEGFGYADNYIVPRSYEPDQMLVDLNYNFRQFTETQQFLFASVPLQLGLYFGNFSMFLGVRAEYPIMGHYWQRIKDAELSLRFPDTGVTIGHSAGNEDESHPEEYEPRTTAGLVKEVASGIKPLQKGAIREWYVNPIIDLNYSFKVGDNTDFAIGIYAEYDPYGHTPQKTDNTSLMMWHYNRNSQNVPVFRRDYYSVMESNRGDGVVMRAQNDFSGERIIKGFHRAAVGIRLSVSLWNVPIDDGNIYRKQGKYKRDCLCDFITN